MKGRRTIAQRTRFFLGCEGESEQGYAIFLNRLADANGQKIHVVARTLREGDPLALVEKAVLEAEREARRGSFAVRSILLDADKLSDDPVRGQRAFELLDRKGFVAIWQMQDHEALLLRHFHGREYDDPPRGQTFASLQREWPNYRKAMPAVDIERVLTTAHVYRAARVTPALRTLLQNFGFPIA